EEFTAGWQQVHVVPPSDEATALELTLDAAQQAVEELVRHDNGLLWVELSTLVPPWETPEEFRDRYLEEPDDEEADEPAEPLSPGTEPVEGLIDPDDDTAFLRLQRTYAGAVSYLDAGLGLLLDDLRERGLLDQLLLVVTADRGLPLGEHGLVGEG